MLECGGMWDLWEREGGGRWYIIECSTPRILCLTVCSVYVCLGDAESMSRCTLLHLLLFSHAV